MELGGLKTRRHRRFRTGRALEPVELRFGEMRFRRVEDIDRFMANMEANGAFADVYAREEAATEDGSRLATIEGRYLPR